MNKAGALHRIEGSETTRRSPRVYTHAVVADFDVASMNEMITKFTIAQAIDGYDYQLENSKLNAGDPYLGGRWTISAEDVEKARTFIAQNPDRDAYVAERTARALSKTPDGTLLVLQWSQSERAARNAVGGWSKRAGNRNVRVVPVIRQA